mmetsp:Transcript_118155/g.220932  ORF Transcript_118155/g.220932 Transcript_118155/m.220932 type:complete len:228 (+) Transcript_118155:1907-2590(+)
MLLGARNHPRVFCGLSCGGSLRGVFLQQLRHEVKLLRTHLVGPHGQLLGVCLLHGVKWELHGEHAPQDHTNRPAVHLVRVVACHNLGSPILHSPKHILQKNAIFQVAGSTEVSENNFEISTLECAPVHQVVVSLDITVDNLHVVKVNYGCQHLGCDLTYAGIGHFFSAFLEAWQHCGNETVLVLFHHKIQEVVISEDIIQADHVWMLHLSHHLKLLGKYFPLDILRL